MRNLLLFVLIFNLCNSNLASDFVFALRFEDEIISSVKRSKILTAKSRPDVILIDEIKKDTLLVNSVSFTGGGEHLMVDFIETDISTELFWEHLKVYATYISMEYLIVNPVTVKFGDRDSLMYLNRKESILEIK